MAQLSAWQDYAAHKLFLQQISIPLTVRNNKCILPGKTGVLSLTLQLNKTLFNPRHTIIGKGIAYVKPVIPPYIATTIKPQLYPTPSLSTEHAHRGCTTWLTE